jgi:hypothetical protein
VRLAGGATWIADSAEKSAEVTESRFGPGVFRPRSRASTPSGVIEICRGSNAATPPVAVLRAWFRPRRGRTVGVQALACGAERDSQEFTRRARSLKAELQLWHPCGVQICSLSIDRGYRSAQPPANCSNRRQCCTLWPLSGPLTKGRKFTLYVIVTSSVPIFTALTSVRMISRRVSQSAWPRLS